MLNQPTIYILKTILSETCLNCKSASFALHSDKEKGKITGSITYVDDYGIKTEVVNIEEEVQ